MTVSLKGIDERSGFNLAAIKEDLAQAIGEERAGRQHGAVGAAMRRAVIAARLDAMQFSDRGDRIASRLARSMEGMVRALFAVTAPPEISRCDLRRRWFWARRISAIFRR